jgi:hypothetical protein
VENKEKIWEPQGHKKTSLLGDPCESGNTEGKERKESHY